MSVLAWTIKLPLWFGSATRPHSRYLQQFCWKPLGNLHHCVVVQWLGQSGYTLYDLTFGYWKYDNQKYTSSILLYHKAAYRYTTQTHTGWSQACLMGNYNCLQFNVTFTTTTTLQQLLHLYGNRADEHEPVIVSVKTCQRQVSSSNCGLFAIANAFALAEKDYVWKTSHSSNSRWEVICTIVCKIRHWQCSHITLCTIIRWNQRPLLFQSSLGQQLQYRNCRSYGNVDHMVM